MLNFAILETGAFWWAVLDGLAVTVALTVLSMLLGFGLGGVLASMQTYGGPVTRLISKVYIFVFRGVPLLILLFLAYYGLLEVDLAQGQFVLGYCSRFAVPYGSLRSDDQQRGLSWRND